MDGARPPEDAAETEYQKVTITVAPKVEEIARRRAEAEGLSIGEYLERLLNAEIAAEEELKALALEALRSGDPHEAPLENWIDRHKRLDEWLNQRHATGPGKTAL
jgi:hypothetical protein